MAEISFRTHTHTYTHDSTTICTLVAARLHADHARRGGVHSVYISDGIKRLSLLARVHVHIVETRTQPSATLNLTHFIALAHMHNARC